MGGFVFYLLIYRTSPFPARQAGWSHSVYLSPAMEWQVRWMVKGWIKVQPANWDTPPDTAKDRQYIEPILHD
jgi:hypothetical protein